jgi:hypothetical protein
VFAGALAPAQATVLLSDNFNKDPLSLNTTVFQGGWGVKNGSVDIHGSGDYWDMHPGNGHYVDLDGSTQAGGTLSQSLALSGGTTYVASFWLGGSGRGDTNIVDIVFGTSTATYTLASGDPLALVDPLTFTPGADGSYELTFTNRGGDNLGAILDNVTVESLRTGDQPGPVVGPQPNNVPEPGTLALALASVGLMAGVARRRRPMR